MILAGIEKLSLVDFPGYISTVIFTQGCNFQCGYCQNPDLLQGNKKFDCNEKDVLDFLAARGTMVEGAVISGGEPCIQEDLPVFLAKIKALGYAVKLDTNGSRPGILEKVLGDKLADYIAVDIKTSPDKYAQFTYEPDIAENLKRSVALVMASGAEYEFRTTCVPGMVEEKDVEEIASLVEGAAKYFLQQFRPAVTYDENFRNLRPYPKETLEGFKNILAPRVKSVRLRGV
jgi:pyruvate formate lyase activating enzyme